MVICGIADPTGFYGTGTAVITRDQPPTTAGMKAAREAIASARLRGANEFDVPALTFVTVSPHDESAVLAGVAHVLPDTKVFGMSSEQAQFSENEAFIESQAKGVVVTVCYTIAQVAHYTKSICSTEEAPLGEITELTGRSIKTINGRNASKVWKEWVQAKPSLSLSNSLVAVNSGDNLHIQKVYDFEEEKVLGLSQTVPEVGSALYGLNVADDGIDAALDSSTRELLGGRDAYGAVLCISKACYNFSSPNVRAFSSLLNSPFLAFLSEAEVDCKLGSTKVSSGNVEGVFFLRP